MKLLLKYNDIYKMLASGLVPVSTPGSTAHRVPRKHGNPAFLNAERVCSYVTSRTTVPGRSTSQCRQ